MSTGQKLGFSLVRTGGGRSAFGAGTSPLMPIQGTCVLVRVQRAIPPEVTGIGRKARGSSGQRRPLSLRLLRDGGEFDFPLVCMLV